jgi:response regulator of citrate/malate metabolism
MAKKKIQIPAETLERWAENMRKLEERIAYHQQKIDEEERRKGAAQP